MLRGNLVAGPKDESCAGPGEGHRGSVRQIGVCHIASGDRWAGAEAQLCTLLRFLARRKQYLLSVILLNDGRVAEEARRCGVEVKIIPERGKNFFQISREATRFLRDKHVQILHSHRYKENLLAALLAWRCGIPFLVRTQHGSAEPFGGLKGLKQTTFQIMDRAVAKYATDRLISVSGELQEQLASYVDPGKVVLIHNGIDLEQVRSTLSVAEAKSRLGLPADGLVIGTAGRLEPVKRLDIFLAAANKIKMRSPGTRFVIVGEGAEQARLHALSRTYGLEDRLVFLPHRDDIYDVLRAFDIFVLCSDHEGLPMILLEALCLGVSVAARSVGGIAEVIQNGVNGVLLESGEADALAETLLSLLADEMRRRRLALAGMNSVACRFSGERTAQAVASLYRSLCGSP